MELQAPGKGAAPNPAAATDAQAARLAEDSAPIRCSACGHGITQASCRREVGGRHVHLRLNPSAFAFLFGCFSAAPGCVVSGPPIEAATWFSGCRWQFAHCGQCLTHLGWAFSGADAFYGLLAERLVEEAGSGAGGGGQ